MAQSHSMYRFSEVDRDDSHEVGSKGTQLGEMVRAGLPVPDGFIISSHAYFSFLKENNLITKINHLLQTVNFTDAHSLLQVSSHIRKLILTGEIPLPIQDEIFRNYRLLGGILTDQPVALRASITTDAIPALNLAGEREAFLWIIGESSLLLKIKELWASLFEARAIYYRHEKKYDHFRVGVSVIVQKMSTSDRSGSLFSLNPLAPDKKTFLIEAVYGITDTDPSQRIPADRYIVNKLTGDLVEKTVVMQTTARERVGMELKQVHLPAAKHQKAKLSEEEIRVLVEIGKKVERLYYFPFELIWATENNNFSVISIKPLTIPETPEGSNALMPSIPLAKGLALTGGIATGYVRKIEDEKDLEKLHSGEIVIVKELTETMLPYLKKSYSIVSQKEITSPHLIQRLKELGRPTLSGMRNTVDGYKTGSVITVNANTGDIFPGGMLPTESHKRSPQMNAVNYSTATKLCLYLENTKDAKQAALLKSDGVGLLNGTSVVMSLGTHPKKIVREHKKAAYVQELSDKLGNICREYHPRPVIYRLSDAGSAGYKLLPGGKALEPVEANPLLGYRGGFRFIHDPEVFSLELEAIKTVRTKLTLTNLQIMLPFIRSANELERVKKIIAAHQLSRSPSFKLWLSVDTPANTVLIDSYIKTGIDGLALNADSLAALFTGIDSENSEVSSLVHEENDALLQAYHYVIRRGQKNAVPTLFYGKSAVHSVPVLEKLVEWGVSGIIISPDSLDNIRKTIYKCERKLIR